MGGALLAWCVGVALQLQQPALNPLAHYGLCLTAALGWGWGAVALWRRWAGPQWLRVLALSLAWAAGAFAVTGMHALTRSAAIDPALEGRDLEVVGMVQAMAQRQDLGWRFRFEIEQAWRLDANGTRQALALERELPAQVYLGWYSQDGREGREGRNGRDDSGWNLSALPEPVKAGERWRLRVRLKAPHGNLNPRGFDYELWLWEQGIGATGYVRTGPKDPAPVRLASTWAHPIEAWRQSVRERLLAHLSAPGADAQAAQRAGVVAALVTGDQAAIDRSDWDVFRATGVAHLMSISGLHVTMLAWLAGALVAWLWRRQALWGGGLALRWPAVQVGAWVGLWVAWFYALFSGWGLPAQRTLLMLLVVVVLRISARQWPLAWVWLLAGAVVLAFDPWALLQPGFWLSFVAVGVLMLADPQRQRVGTTAPEVGQPDAPVWRFEARWGAPWHHIGAESVLQAGRAGLHKALALVREQATITLALAPLTLLFFGQVSLVGLAANLLAIPWVTLVVTPLAMLGVLWPDAWTLAAWCLKPLSAMLGAMATWPMASVSSAIPPWGLALLALAGALGLVMKMPWSWKLLCLPLLWPLLFWAHPRPASGQFELLAADVGQGNAVLVRTATHSLLYDAGPRYSAESDAGHRVLVPLLGQMGERLDGLMLSHRDSDHTGGAAAVLAMQPQALLWSSLEDDHPLHALRPGFTRCQAGQFWVWDGVRFDVLHPPLAPGFAPQGPLAPGIAPQGALGDAPASPQPGRVGRAAQPNTVSCVLRIDNGQASALLTGDIEAAQELALVQAPVGLRPVDLLLVPHHGSQTSSTLAFLQALQPRLALVQAGYRNRFGHPAAPVLARYRALGIELVESSRCGAATWQSGQPDQLGCERQRARRYWHHAVPP